MRYHPLTRNNEFARAYTRGKSFVHPHVVLYVNKNRLGRTRVGITASKKIGNAVTRNRARRVLRAALYEVLPPDVGGYDLVLVARGQTPRLKSTQVAKTLERQLRAAGLRQSMRRQCAGHSILRRRIAAAFADDALARGGHQKRTAVDTHGTDVRNQAQILLICFTEPHTGVKADALLRNIYFVRLPQPVLKKAPHANQNILFGIFL